MFFDPTLLARIQFAFTISFHIIFPAFTIGLSAYLACVEGLYLKTKNPVYKKIYQFWVKIFAIAFAMGVVTGIVLSYQIGTNWSGFSLRTGNIIGPLFGYEVLTAFFLEASFLGIMLFGWNKVSNRTHFISTVIVAIGTLISAFWVISANSWMQTPQGFKIMNGIFYPTNWIDIIFNPSFLYRFVHMTLATYLTAAFVVAGVSSWFLWKKRSPQHSKVMLKMALGFIVIVAPMQIFIGDLHGLNTLKYQPAKVAAMEGLWKDEQGAPLTLFGIPDEKTKTIKYAIKVPKMASIILKHDSKAVIQGVDSFKHSPPLAPVFYSFRIMVGIGMMMLATAIMAIVLHFRNRLYDSKWFQLWCMAMTPSGFIALLAGWFVTEIGRQPYLVYGHLLTKDAVSNISAEHVLVSLTTFIVVYFVIFGAATFYILRLIAGGFKASVDK